MKTSKMVKILVMFLMVAIIIMSTTSVFAANGDKKSDSISEPNSITASKTAADSLIGDYGGKILSAVTTAGIVLSVVVLAVLGVKYMLGSSEEKAEYKKTLMPYLIGAALVFGASTIAQIVFKFFTEI